MARTVHRREGRALEDQAAFGELTIQDCCKTGGPDQNSPSQLAQKIQHAIKEGLLEDAKPCEVAVPNHHVYKYRACAREGQAPAINQGAGKVEQSGEKYPYKSG